MRLIIWLKKLFAKRIYVDYSVNVGTGAKPNCDKYETIKLGKGAFGSK